MNPPSSPRRGTRPRQLLGVSAGSLDRAKRVVRDGTDSLKSAVEAGEVSLSKAGQISTLPPNEQDAYVEHIHAGGNPHRSPSDAPAGPVVTRREAKYRYVQRSALQLFADSFDALAMVLNSAEGLDPAITAEEAARWKGGLSRKAKSLRHLMTLLKERSK